MATLLKVLNNLADIKSAGGVALRVRTQDLSRRPIVYLRQSTAAQVENNRESTDRQYALAAKARDLGWPDGRIVVIDEDLGLSGSGSTARSGFARLTSEVALARVGLVLGLEVSRLARNKPPGPHACKSCNSFD